MSDEGSRRGVFVRESHRGCLGDRAAA